MMVDAGGLLPRRAIAAQLGQLDKADRHALHHLRVRLGALDLFSQGLLKPGMTATADIAVKAATNVVNVPNGALRFTPVAAAAVTMVPVATVAPSDPVASGKGKLWVDVKGKEPQSIDVTLGITDGQRTQITSSNVKAGDEYILDIAQANGQAK